MKELLITYKCYNPVVHHIYEWLRWMMLVLMQLLTQKKIKRCLWQERMTFIKRLAMISRLQVVETR